MHINIERSPDCSQGSLDALIFYFHLNACYWDPVFEVHTTSCLKADAALEVDISDIKSASQMSGMWVYSGGSLGDFTTDTMKHAGPAAACSAG